MDLADRRHFPLTNIAHRAIKVIASAYVLGTRTEDMVHSDLYVGTALDALSAELGETDEYESVGARRYGALLFAIPAAKLYYAPEDLGWFMPMR